MVSLSVHHNCWFHRSKPTYLPAENIIWDDLTVAEHLKVFAALNGNWSARHSWHVWASRFGLLDESYKRGVELDIEARRRLGLACAFIGGAEVVCLQSPTKDLNSTAATSIWETLSVRQNSRLGLLVF